MQVFNQTFYCFNNYSSWVPWVKAKDSDCDDKCKATAFFDEKKSSTFEKGPGDFKFGYKGGETSGTIGLDTVSVD